MYGAWESKLGLICINVIKHVYFRISHAHSWKSIKVHMQVNVLFIACVCVHADEREKADPFII